MLVIRMKSAYVVVVAQKKGERMTCMLLSDSVDNCEPDPIRWIVAQGGRPHGSSSLYTSFCVLHQHKHNEGFAHNLANDLFLLEV
jgi:hypothetical protein